MPLAVVILGCSHTLIFGQAKDGKFATEAAGASSVRWNMVNSSGATLVVMAPDGRIFRREFGTGTAPEFQTFDNQGERLPDGIYTYEIRLGPSSGLSINELKSARPRDDEAEADRVGRKRLTLPGQV